jgi:hypothetical protein
MSMHFVIMALAGQLTLAPIASPPPLQADQIAETMRRACLSEAGVKTVVASWLSRNQPADAAARRQTMNAIDEEIGVAAWTVPIDVDRLARAKQARDEDQARRLAQSTEDSIAILRNLSPADRVIYARRMSTRESMVPVKTCTPPAKAAH